MWMEETSFDLISKGGFYPLGGFSGGFDITIEFCGGFWMGGVCGFLDFAFTTDLGGLVSDSFTSS